MPGDNGQPSTGASGAPLASTTRLPPLYYGPGGKILDTPASYVWRRMVAM